MKVVNIDAMAAEDALVQLAQHVGVDVALGKPLVAQQGDDEGEVRFLVEYGADGGAVWFVTDQEASRLIGLEGVGVATVELTRYRDGAEVDRTIARERDLHRP